jgi:hypothetical protein
MGTISFSVGKYARASNSSILSTEVMTSGTFGTSTSAQVLQGGAGIVELTIGQVIQLFASEDLRISFGGIAATASTGHFVPSGAQREFECRHAGTVSVVDVA